MGWTGEFRDRDADVQPDSLSGDNKGLTCDTRLIKRVNMLSVEQRHVCLLYESSMNQRVAPPKGPRKRCNLKCKRKSSMNYSQEPL